MTCMRRETLCTTPYRDEMGMVWDRRTEGNHERQPDIEREHAPTAPKKTRRITQPKDNTKQTGKTMKKTIEIDKTDTTKIKVGDRVTLVGSGNTYTITKVDASDRILPVKVDVFEDFRKEDADDIRALVNVTEWWVTPGQIERITREVDAPEWPTPTRNNTAYLGADGAIYVYTKKDDDDVIPWFRLFDGDHDWFSSHEIADSHPDALPLRELKTIENEEES